MKYISKQVNMLKTNEFCKYYSDFHLNHCSIVKIVLITFNDISTIDN